MESSMLKCLFQKRIFEEKIIFARITYFFYIYLMSTAYIYVYCENFSIS